MSASTIASPTTSTTQSATTHCPPSTNPAKIELLGIQQFVITYDGSIEYNTQEWDKQQPLSFSQLFFIEKTTITAVEIKPAPLHVQSPLENFLTFTHSASGATPHSLLFSEFLRCVRAVAFAQFCIVVRDKTKQKSFFFVLTPDGLRFTKTTVWAPSSSSSSSDVSPDARVAPISAIIAVVTQDPSDYNLRFRYSHMVHVSNGRVRIPSTLSSIALKDWIEKIETACIQCTRESYVCFQDINDMVFTDNPFTPHITRHVGRVHKNTDDNK
jgi:hypothetical protein